jgi:hypothetical protein
VTLKNSSVGRETLFRVEAEESPLLEGVTRQLLAKTLQPGKDFACDLYGAVIKCNYELSAKVANKSKTPSIGTPYYVTLFTDSVTMNWGWTPKYLEET